MRFFHSLAGVGTSFGFPQVTALAKEGELECLAVLHDKAALSPTEIENWTRLVGALAHELSQPPDHVRRRQRAARAWSTRHPGGPAREPGRARWRRPLAAAHRAGGARGPAACPRGPRPRRPSAQALPDALIVDAALADGSGYDVIDQLRAMPGGEAVPVLVLGPRGGFMDKVEAIHGGADGYFEKPVDWKALMRRLQHLLDASQPHAARILSVEDDPQQAAYLKSILESGGYEVAVCADPKRVRDRARRVPARSRADGHPAPRRSAATTSSRYLRQDERNAALPVLFLTTESQMQSRFRSAQVGGDDHLTKPIVPPVLLSVVASRLERARFLKNLLNRDGLTRLLHPHRAHRARPRPCTPQKERDRSPALRLGDDRPRSLQVRQRPLRPSGGRPRAGHPGRAPAPAPAPVGHHRAATAARSSWSSSRACRRPRSCASWSACSRSSARSTWRRRASRPSGPRSAPAWPC